LECPAMTETTADRPVDTSTPGTAVTTWLADFEKALTAGDIDAAADLFVDDCYWRDLVAFSWNIVTAEGRAGVRDMLGQTLKQVKPRGFAIAAELGEPAEAGGVTESWIRFETSAGRGLGHLRLRDDKAWTLLTTLDELKGHEEPKSDRRPRGTEHGAVPNRQTWLEQRRREAEDLGHVTQPYALIVGGGQGGIALGARLRQLGVPTIIVDRNPRPGDAWRKRYKSLCLHDPVWYDHLPYIDFPPNWPVFSPKDKIADWLEMYTRVMELNYWGSTECKSASYDETAKEWTVVVERDGAELTLRPKQLVLATGMSGKPSLPNFEGMDVFTGEQHHSSRHPGPDGYKGKKAVVIGSNNSAHDICAALWEVGADVTMVQRTSTHVARSDSLMELALGGLYSESAVASGMTTQKADLTFASVPYRILHIFQVPVYAAIRERDADFYARLKKAGFLLDFGDDDSGLFMKYLRRGSGYYIDVGASELVANGDIKLESGVEVVRLTENAVVLSNGKELPADLVVYATGYGSMNGWAADLISPEVAAKVGKVWGLGSDTRKDPGPWEGELRNMWKPTQQEALWFHGGNLHQSRHYSSYLALQLKARMEGIPTPVYGLQEVHHAN
jgi:putative flavoprotein involved in K+ transport